MKTRKTPSLRALDELYCATLTRCKEAYHDKSYDRTVGIPCTKEHRELLEAQNKIRATISKEIEEYSVKKYPQYRVKILEVCKRKNDSGDHTLNVQLAVREYPELKEEVAKMTAVVEEYLEARRVLDEWHYKALQAIAQRESMPELPEYEMRE